MKTKKTETKVPATTTEKNTYIKVPLPGVIFFLILLSITSFFSGISWTKGKTGQSTSSTSSKDASAFDVKKTNKPELKFFVMSFCPYGNQIEDVLRPVFDLIGNKVEIKPQYIFDKIEGNLGDYCKTRSGDINQCETYVKNSNGQLKNVEECKKLITENYNKCADETTYLKAGNNLYTSLHGRIEANQDVREICAWNQTENNRKGWWDFVANVNKNCNDKNADTCWEEQAKSAGLDTNKITECFNKQAGELIEKEIALTNEFKVQGSPTVLINESIFPPEAAYAQDGKGSIKLGNKVITQDQFRTPNGIKEAVCASFNKSPKECSKELAAPSGTAPAAGGCAQ